MNTGKASRKEVIVNEIQLWKQTNMLPEHYCDYLLALYTGGEGMDPYVREDNKRTFILTDFLLSIGAIAISLFVIYFTELSIVLQTTILASFVVLLVGLGIYYTRKQKSPLLIYLASAFIFLLVSIEATDVFMNGRSTPMYITLFSNCLLWVGAGLKWKSAYFTFSGVAGTVLLLVFISL
ncbi:hypothetical protein QTG56_12650 [Rossellomorea sp. AcN35-11]|nr:hypothetical protein [Rossellomorea aquimaris]NMH69733.1 hypothetical protein [Bacillus sp. RO3]WJV28002.1 hypothetical protein QTG56_12650 [Rossellomorea sp. AcN35-11]